MFRLFATALGLMALCASWSLALNPQPLPPKDRAHERSFVLLPSRVVAPSRASIFLRQAPVYFSPKVLGTKVQAGPQPEPPLQFRSIRR